MSRGSYRAIHTVLLDGPDYQALSPHAKLVLLTAKLSLGPTGIDVLYPAVLQAQTGLSITQVMRSLAALETAGWIRSERNLVWIVEGLRYEPSRSLSNQNHRTEIDAHLASLPRLPLVDAFRIHYGILLPETPISQPIPDAIQHTIHNGIGDTIPKHGERETEKGKRRTENGNRVRTIAPRVVPEDDGFAQFWQEYPNRLGNNPKPRAEKAWAARRREGVEAGTILAGLQRYKAYLVPAGRGGTEFVLQAASFLGRDRGWEQAWELGSATDEAAALEARAAAERAAAERDELWLASRRATLAGATP